MDAQDVLIATGSATAFATLASFGFSLLWRRLDRREADWIAFEASTRWGSNEYGDEDEGPWLRCTLANVGDAAAFKVRADGFGCRASIGTKYDPRSGRRAFQVVPSMEPGKDVELFAWCDPAVWDEAFVAITWIASPTRRKRWSRRMHVLQLQQVAEPPQYLTRSELDEETLQYSESYGAPPEGWQLPEQVAPQWPLLEPQRWAWGRWRTKRRLRRELHARS